MTRTDAKKLIRSGRVSIDGVDTPRADLKITSQTVTVDNELIAYPGNETRCIAFHKPANVECSHSSSHYPIVFDLLPRTFQDFQVAGRLDADTTGLVLLTNSGQLNHAITHPRRESHKVYRVTAKHPISDEAITQLSNGVVLNDSDTPTQPASVVRLSDTEIELTISEGRYHQVKRMLAAVSNRVTGLHRQAIGRVELDINEGEWRELTPKELEYFNGR
ncbi:MAG: pseudouridine synthase [Gammaproteobacteria bacterium]|nr:pseudouridine synthase [Gammaproteobacteria bacterium]